MPKTYFNWSSGKDSALAFHLIENRPDLLITTINSHFERVTMHGLRVSLLEKQARNLGIPLELVELPENASMESYETIWKAKLAELVERGYTDTVFGDIFLEDLKTYREQQLAPFHISSHFPIWRRDTAALMHQFFELGFRAVVVSASSKYFDKDFVGSELTPAVIEQLPEGVDPCGENGEFHTFCFDGPIFQEPVSFQTGTKKHQEYPSPTPGESAGFWFCDLMPQDE